MTSHLRTTRRRDGVLEAVALASRSSRPANGVLGLGLGLEAVVLGLGLRCQVLGLEGQVLGLGLGLACGGLDSKSEASLAIWDRTVLSTTRHK